jgi:hypothetical protein
MAQELEKSRPLKGLLFRQTKVPTEPSAWAGDPIAPATATSSCVQITDEFFRDSSACNGRLATSPPVVEIWSSQPMPPRCAVPTRGSRKGSVPYGTQGPSDWVLTWSPLLKCHGLDCAHIFHVVTHIPGVLARFFELGHSTRKTNCHRANAIRAVCHLAISRKESSDRYTFSSTTAEGFMRAD